jgi:hypothetical protein
MKSKKLQGCVFKSGTWSYRRRLRGKAAEILGKQNLIFPLSSDTRVAEQLAPKARQKADEIVRRAERGEGDLELALRLREDYHEAIDYDPIYEEWESKHGYPKALQLAKVVQGRSTPLEVGLEQRLRHDPLGSAAEADTRQALRELQDTPGVWSIEEVTGQRCGSSLSTCCGSPGHVQPP